MKNKKLVYLLLLVSVVVWGWIFLKVINAFTNTSDSPIVSKKSIRFSNNNESVKDSFVLLLNYEDPFFKKGTRGYTYNSSGIKNSVKKQIVKKSLTPKVVEPVVQMDWGFIKFVGTIKRKSIDKTLTLLNVNGGDYSVEEGKEVAKVLLVKNCKDSVLVKYNGISKYIKKN